MATVEARITRALRLLGELGSGESATTDELADGLTALNAMLDSWRNDRLMCYAFQEETITLANADSSYTLGPTGDVVTTRPVEIHRAWVVDSGNTYAVTLRDEDWWADIPDKTSAGDWPTDALFRPTMPNATIHVYPVPNQAGTLKVLTRVAVGAFASTATTVTLPPGWEGAIDANLAVWMAPEYQTRPSPEVVKMAADTLAGIKRSNIKAQPPQVQTELGALFGSRSGNILTDA